ncbi:MAG: hypothetical protein U1F35_17805 [Steroidobacteraceae bacterium]
MAFPEVHVRRGPRNSDRRLQAADPIEFGSAKGSALQCAKGEESRFRHLDACLGGESRVESPSAQTSDVPHAGNFTVVDPHSANSRVDISPVRGAYHRAAWAGHLAASRPSAAVAATPVASSRPDPNCPCQREKIGVLPGDFQILRRCEAKRSDGAVPDDGETIQCGERCWITTTVPDCAIHEQQAPAIRKAIMNESWHRQRASSRKRVRPGSKRIFEW